MKNVRRFLSLLLSLCVAFSLVSVAAFAESGTVATVELSGIPAVQVGDAVPEPAVEVPADANYEIIDRIWTELDEEAATFVGTSDTVFEEKDYQLFLYVCTKDGYTFEPMGILSLLADFPHDNYAFNLVDDSTLFVWVNYSFAPQPISIDSVMLYDVPEAIEPGDSTELNITAGEDSYTVSAAWYTEQGIYEESTFAEDMYQLQLTVKPVAPNYLGDAVMENIAINDAYGWEYSAELDAEELRIMIPYDLRPVISVVEVTGVPEAKVGETADTSGVKIPEDANYTMDAYWIDSVPEVFTGVFKNENYRLNLAFEPKDGYRFSDDVLLTVDGNEIYDFNSNADSMMYQIYVNLCAPVTQIEVSNFPEAVLGEALPVADIKVPEDANYAVISQGWYDGNYDEADAATEKDFYTFSVVIEPFENYMMDPQGVSVKVDGELLRPFSTEDGWYWQSDENYAVVEKVFDFRDVIAGVEVTGGPVAEAEKTVDATQMKISENAAYELEYTEIWDVYSGEEAESFKAGGEYCVYAELAAKDGYKFSKDLAATLDGGLWDEILLADDDEFVMLYKYYTLPSAAVEQENVIETVEVDGVPVLEAGKEIDLSAIKVPEGVHYSVSYAEVYDRNSGEIVTGKLENGKEYSLEMYIVPDEGWKFGQGARVILNGKEDGESTYVSESVIEVYRYIDLSTPIESVQFTGAAEPELGKTPVSTGVSVSAESHVKEFSVNWKKWDYDRGIFADFDGIFEAGNVYARDISFVLEDGCYFEGEATVNGQDTEYLGGSPNSATVRNTFNFVEQEITQVDLDIVFPQVGNRMNEENIQVKDGAPCYVSMKYWYDDNHMGNVIVDNTIVLAELELNPENGYVFAPDVKVTINGKNADIEVFDLTSIVLRLSAYFDTTVREEGTMGIRDYRILQLYWATPDPAMGVTLDVSGTASATSKVEMYAQELEFLGEKGVSLNVVTDAAAITMDPIAMKAATSTALDESVLSLMVKYIEQSSLNEAQQAALTDKLVAGVISAQMMCDGTYIKDFGGGTVTVSIGFAPAEGTDIGNYSVRYLAEDGQLAEQPATYENGSWILPLKHFSEYVILYTLPVTENDIPAASNPSTGDEFPVAAFVAIAAMSLLGMAVVVFAKKRTHK